MKKQLKRFGQRIANQLGYEVHRIPQLANSSSKGEYGRVLPRATYRPWEKDDSFQKTYSLVKEHTKVDKYRCFELWKMVEQSAKLENGSLIEVGVWRGGTGSLIARQATRCRLKKKVFLCDTFEGVVKAGGRDSTYKGGEHADTTERDVKILAHEKMNLSNVDILKGVFPDDTGHVVANMEFRLCHIDVDVYQSAKDIVSWIWKRMVPGGIIIYDDYGFEGCNGIAEYVEEQTEYDDRLVMHNLNGHAIVVKL